MRSGDHKERILVEQRLKDLGPVNGRRVRLGAKAKSSDAGQLQLAIRYRVDGDSHYFSRRHPGNGEWRTLAAEGVIPTDADPDFLIVMIVLDKEATTPALIDDVAIGVN